MTIQARISIEGAIIPYQELLGNYDCIHCLHPPKNIIPYQELLGNYDRDAQRRQVQHIIPYQELLGNYDVLMNI